MTALSVARGSLPEHVYDRLRSMILRGRLAPGARLVEAEVAQRLEVGRTPVREALQRLLQEGYAVPVAPGKRTQLMVAPLTRDDLLEVYAIVAALEGVAAREAAELAPEARGLLVEDMRANIVEFAAVAAARPLDLDRIFELHRAFHQLIAEAGAGPRLRAVYGIIRPQVERYEWIYAPLLETELGLSVDEHVAVVRALEDGDAEGAERAVRTNWKNAATRLAQAVERMGERGAW
jgi:DNA-binding GntR family transcriptional regulator